MITAYYRPRTIQEAKKLLAQPDTYPLGGGTILNQPSDRSIAVVDLQALGLDKIRKLDEKLTIGATVKLQSLYESSHTPKALKSTIKLEASLNLRNMGTVAGSLVGCDGRSPFLTTMLALDANLILYPNDEIIPLGDFLPLRTESRRARLITKVEIPLNMHLSYEYVARTPGDKPIICAALSQWSSGRTRLVLGGWGASPSLVMDGNISPADGLSTLEQVARNAALDASDDWASSKYRCEMAAVLAKRCFSG